MIVIILIAIFAIMLLVALWCAFELAKRSEEQAEIERRLRK